MKINKLEIKGFGKFQDMIITLDKGLNIIFGGNESGKSTIQSYIRAMLYSFSGFNNGKDIENNLFKKYKPWKGNSYSGSLEYTLNNLNFYRVERDFETQSCKVFDGNFTDITKEYDYDKESGPLFAKKHLGISQEIFDNSFFIKQNSIRLSNIHRKDMFERITNIVQTGEEDVSLEKAKEVINLALKKYVGNDRTSARPLDKLNDKIALLEDEKNILEGKRNILFEEEQRLKNIKNEKLSINEDENILKDLSFTISLFKELENEKCKKQKILKLLSNIAENREELKLLNEKNIEYLDLSQKMADNGDKEDKKDIFVEYFRYNEYKNKISEMEETLKIAINKVTEKEQELQVLNKLGIIKNDDILKLKTLENKINKLNEDKKTIEDKEIITNSTKQSKIVRFIKSKGGLVVAFPLVLILIFMFNISITLGSVLLILLVGIIIYLLKGKLKGFEGNVLRAEIKKIHEEINAKNQELKELLMNFGMESASEFFEKLNHYEFSIKEFETLNEHIEKLEMEIQEIKYKFIRTETYIKDRLMGVKLLNEDGIFEETEIAKYKELQNRFITMEATQSDRNFRTHQAEEYIKDYEEEISSITSSTNVLDVTPNNCINILEAKIQEIEDKVNKNKIEFEDKISAEAYSLIEVKQLLTQENYGFAQNKLNEIIDQTNFKKRNIELKEIESKVLLRDYDFLVEQLTRIEIEMFLINKEKQELLELSEILKISSQVMNESAEEIRKEFLPKINNQISHISKRLTAGKYENIKVDNDGNIKAIEPSTGDIVNVKALSVGTIEQIYLALRLAMTQMLTLNEKLPIILDEVFVFYDDLRMAETVKLLEELSIERQIILFTSKKREIEVIKEIKNSEMNLIML